VIDALADQGVGADVGPVIYRTGDGMDRIFRDTFRFLYGPRHSDNPDRTRRSHIQAVFPLIYGRIVQASVSDVADLDPGGG